MNKTKTRRRRIDFANDLTEPEVIAKYLPASRKHSTV